jgi:hypothetical protein
MQETLNQKKKMCRVFTRRLSIYNFAKTFLKAQRKNNKKNTTFKFWSVSSFSAKTIGIVKQKPKILYGSL